MSKNKYAIAIVGNKETILGFKALGLDTFDANTPEEAAKVLFELKSATIESEEKGEPRAKYAIIFVTEDLAIKISKEDYKKLSGSALPAIIPVPGSTGAKGYGIHRIGKMVEQAVGSDIFKE